MGQIFTIDNGQPPLVDKFTDEELLEEMRLNPSRGLAGLKPVPSPGSSDVVTNEYTRPLFQIYGFGVSQMYIHLTSVILMSILVLISLVSGFKK